MAQYAIRRGNAPAEVFIGEGVATNLGPGTIFFADNQDVTTTSYEGSLAPNVSISLDGVQWFTTDSPRASLYVVPGEQTAARGPKGDPGLPGAPGPAGQDAVASSDAIRIENGRFAREIAASLLFTGAGFVAQTDAFSRPQNIDTVTTDTAKITVVHEDIAALHIIGQPQAIVGENLRSVGIDAFTRPSSDLKSTAVLLRQTRSFDDTVSYNGATWDKEKGAASPFTVTFSANALHITHADIGSTRVSDIRLTGLGTLRPVLKRSTVTATAFDIEFYDAAGSVATSASTNMAVGISRGVRDLPVNPTSLVVQVPIQKEQDWDELVPSLTPILWARLGEAAGTSFNDEIGSNDGTSTATVTLGATGTISGDADDAVTLDGTQGKIAFAAPAVTGPFSVSLWFKCTGAGSVGNTTYGTLVGSAGNRRLLYHRTSHLIRAEMGGAALSTANESAALNAWNHVVYTWDGTTQRLIVNGVLLAEGVTAGITFNSAFWLGSYAGTSTNYSFKGDMDELIVFDRAIGVADSQALYVTGADSVVTVDRALQARIGFRAEVETVAPLPEPPEDLPAPVADLLPASDLGGAASSYISLKPYRDDGTLDFGPSSPWCHRPLPDAQLDRDAIALNGLSGLPNATSENWRLHCCSMFGINPATGAPAAATQGGSLPMYLRVQGEWIYVVPDTQPRRTVDDTDTSVSGWAAAFEAAETTLGGLPVPANALPHSTADRYAFVFQPDTQTWATLYAFQTSVSQRAATILELTGGPSSGGFFMEFDYVDNVNQTMTTYYCQSPILYNATAAQITTIISAAKSTAGSVFGSTRSGSLSTVNTGGPLNVAPIRIEWPLGGPLQPVAVRFTTNFLNAGSVGVTYENAEAWGAGRLCAVTSPALVGNHKPTGGVDGVAAGNGGTAAATGIDWMPMIIDWDEYNTAYETGLADGWDAAGTDLGHVIAMSIGNAGTGFVYPAIRSDGTLSNADGSKVRQGALGTFTVTADTSRILPAAPELMPLFNTIQRYGFIPIDKTGSSCEFIFRNWKFPGESRPFPGPSTFKLGSANYLPYMQRLPWEDLQFIDPVEVQAGW